MEHGARLGTVGANGPLLSDTTEATEANTSPDTVGGGETARREHPPLTQLLHDAIESIPNGFAILDAQGRLVFCNIAFASLFGADAEDMVGSHATDILRRVLPLLRVFDNEPADTSDAGAGRALDRLHAANGAPVEMQLKTGQWLKVTCQAMAAGGWTYVATPISRPKLTDSGLRQRQEILEDAIESLAEGFALYDADDRLVMCNQRYRDFNRECAHVLVPGVKWADVVRTCAERGQYRAAMGRIEEWVEERAELRARMATDLEMQQADGRWFQLRNRRTRHGGIVVTRTDITQHKDLEQALRDSESLIRRVVEACALPVSMTRCEDGTIIYQSPAYCELYGRDDCGEGGGPACARDMYVDPADRQRFIDGLHAHGVVNDFEVQLKRHDGSRFWGSMSGRLIEYQGEEVIVCSTVDLTERRSVEKQMAEQKEALRLSEERFRRLLEACPVPVGMTRAEDGEVIYESPAAKALFGRGGDPDAVERARDYFADPAKRATYLARLRKDRALDDYELCLKKTDGSTFWAAISARLIEYEGDEVIVSSVFDLTERKAVQEQMARQREALHQNEKLSALGSLLAGIAHELNNPLSVVVGQALLLEETTADRTIAERAAKIGHAADRCSRIVRTFLAMARQQASERAAVDINEIVEATLEVTGYSLRTAGIDVTLELAEDLPSIWADADQLNQVVTNLIVNAQQAMAENAGAQCLEIVSVFDRPYGRVLLSVKDTGPGIAPELHRRIFEPFFTTKEVGAGTGIGLAVCHKIIESHSGAITVKSQPGKGAAFTISLPVAGTETSVVSAPEPETSEVPCCRVLIIDDEPEVARMLRDMLAVQGHAVKTADSGKGALNLLARHDFDIILSDLRMPNMDGPRLYEALKELSPKLLGRVAFITGDTFSPSVSDFLKQSGRPYLQKPFSPGEVHELMAKVLASEHIETLLA